MLIEFDDRESSSPYVERVWRSRSSIGGSFLSMADSNIELVFSRLPDGHSVTLRGPVSHASRVACPADGRWLAIRFRVGTYLPEFPTLALADHQNMQLPVLAGGRFLLAGDAWEIPCFGNAEQLVDGLMKAGAIAHSTHTHAVLHGRDTIASKRSLQRHFHHITGMTFSRHQKIQRARNAAALLMGGHSLLDAAFEAGYFDQAHLTHSMRDLIGITPARLAREKPQLSFSYKTTSASSSMGSSTT